VMASVLSLTECAIGWYAYSKPTSRYLHTNPPLHTEPIQTNLHERAFLVNYSLTIISTTRHVTTIIHSLINLFWLLISISRSKLYMTLLFMHIYLILSVDIPCKVFYSKVLLRVTSYLYKMSIY